MTIESPLNSWLTRRKSQRIADGVIAGVLLTLTLPLVINRCRRDLDSPGPVFERKLCVGRGSRRLQKTGSRICSSGQKTAYCSERFAYRKGFSETAWRGSEYAADRDQAKH